MTDLLRGCIDLHIHSFPDSGSRRLDDRALAQSESAAGMAGFVIKCHYMPTVDRAWHLQEAYPGCGAVGGLCLNGSVGGLNAAAVEVSAEHGARLVWFPTMDAAHCRRFVEQRMPHHLRLQSKLVELGVQSPPVAVTDANGRLVPEVYDVLAVVKAYGLTLCTGHVSPVEGLAVVKAAHEAGIEKIVATHVNWQATLYTEEQCLALLRYGALLEFCWAHVPTDTMQRAAQYQWLRRMGPDNCVISTDFGQPENPEPATGFAQFLQSLYDFGLRERELRLMAADNPRRLVAD